MDIAIVTGASSGIGAATARALAAVGYKVVLVARSREGLEQVADEIRQAGNGSQAVVEACDAGDGTAVLAMAGRVRREHGQPSLIVNGAGEGDWKRIEETSPAEARHMMQAPYFAAFNVTHAFMAGMLQQNRGMIIHINSPACFVCWPSSVGYAACRMALRGLHESLVADLRRTKVHSCHVVFGMVDTHFFQRYPGMYEKIPGISRTIRQLSAEECARVIVRLVKRPQRQLIYPWMLRFYVWNYALFPRLVSWLVWRTSKA